jgi:hypothetical protein
MWKAKNASHIRTAQTATARYSRSQPKIENLQLWLGEKRGQATESPLFCKDVVLLVVTLLPLYGSARSFVGNPV